MKQSTFFFKLSCFLLLLLNITLLFLIRNRNEERQNLFQLNESAIDTIRQLKQHSDNLLLQITLSMELQEDTIDSEIVLLDEIGNTVILNNLFEGSPKLIFKYSELSCETCVDEQFKLLEKASEKIGAENILIIANYDSPRKLSQFLRMNQIKFKLPSVPT